MITARQLRLLIREHLFHAKRHLIDQFSDGKSPKIFTVRFQQFYAAFVKNLRALQIVRFKMMESGGKLNEALQKIRRVSVLLVPQLFPCFVSVIKLPGIEVLDSFEVARIKHDAYLTI